MPNVVREDVVQISFDVNNSGLTEADALTDKLTNGMAKMDIGVNDLNDSATGLKNTLSETIATASSGFAGATNELTETSRAVDFVNDHIAQFDKGMDVAKRSVSEFALKLRDIAGVGIDKIIHPIQTIKTALGSAKEAAGDFVTRLKDIGKQKITTLTTGLKQITSVLTQGRTGLTGFTTALKNIGKISITSTVNGIKSIGEGVKNSLPKLKELAKTSLDKLSNGLTAVGSALKNIASKAASAAAEIGKISLKGLAVAGTAAAVGIGAAVTQAVTQYADYEQLIGGVETLFKDSAGTVQQYARDAFQTTGLSANDYMETVTGFSASMIQSLGGDTAKAAELSNQALIDMSDNANKMGTDMESIQYAYQGFAKQNYTMLDNLKLGYGGTQEEMQRLLSDAEKLTGQKYDISSFADVTEAIHAIQTEMGITGTTAKEASTTISGSLNSMKAAWQNVLVDLVNGGDNLDNSINALVQSAMTFGDNIIPAVEKALSGLNTMIAEMAPVIADVFAQLVSTLLPSLINSVVTLLQTLMTSIAANGLQITQGLISAVMMAIQGLVTLIPMMLDTATQLIMGLIQGLTAAAPQLINSAVMMLNTLVNGIVSNLPMLLSAALNLVMALANGIISNLPTIIQAAVNLGVGLIQGLVSMLPQVIQMGIQLVIQLALGLIQAIPQLIAAIPQIVSAIWNGITSVNWLDLGVQIVKGIWDGIKSLAGSVWDGIKSIFTGGGSIAELDSIGQSTGASYANSLSSGLQTVTPNIAPFTSGLDIDLTEQGTSSAASWGAGFSSGISTQQTVTDVGVVASSFSMDLTPQGISSAESWSNGLTTGLTTEGASLSTVSANIKTVLNMDLTTEGAQSAVTWGNGFMTGINSVSVDLINMINALKAGLTLDLSEQGNVMTMTIVNACTTCVSCVNETIVQITESISSGCVTAIATITSGTNATKSIVQDSSRQIVSQVKSSIGSFNSVLRSGINTAVSTARNGANQIKSALTINLSSVGKNITSGLLNGMKSGANSVLNYAKSLANSIKSTVSEALDINSPSKVMYELGKFTVQGISLGINDNIPTAEKSAENLSNIYTPEKDTAVYNSNSNSSEVNNFNPSFELNIIGSNNGRDIERKVKKWVQEAMQEMLESMARRNPQVQTI